MTDADQERDHAPVQDAEEVREEVVLGWSVPFATSHAPFCRRSDDPPAAGSPLRIPQPHLPRHGQVLPELGSDLLRWVGRQSPDRAPCTRLR